MNRLSQLHQNPKHKLAKDSAFMNRLCFKITKEKPSKVDCINLMQQYVHLYRAMEEKILEFPGDPHVSFFSNLPWKDRSKLLDFDVQEMKEQLTAQELRLLDREGFVYPAMQEMISNIKQADAVNLLSCYAVRCLCDVFDGHHLSHYNQKVFKPQNLMGWFYSSVTAAEKEIASFINGKDLFTSDENEQFFKAADVFLEGHIQLFKQMEEQRIAASSNHYKTCLKYTLFAMTAAASVTTSYYLTQQKELSSQAPF